MTLIGQNEEIKKIVLRMLTELLSMLEDSCEDIGHFVGLEKKWYGTHGCKPDGQWDEVAENMMINFAESIFRASSASGRGDLKSKGMKSIHFNGSDETIELILQTVLSVNQLSVYGAVADLCGEIVRDSKKRYGGDPERLRIWNLWFFRPHFRQLIKFLRLMPKYKEVMGSCRECTFPRSDESS